jgi:predicted nucleic acid-binding protein
LKTRTTLLDTNVLSELMRPLPDPKVAAFVEGLVDPRVSAAVFHELIYGVEIMPEGSRKAQIAARVEEFQMRFGDRTIAIDAKVAGVSGRLRAAEKRSGFALKEMDALIAATALSHPARLATRNTRDFQRLGIELVNPWD